MELYFDWQKYLQMEIALICLGGVSYTTLTRELAEICITSCVQKVWVVELIRGPAEIRNGDS